MGVGISMGGLAGAVAKEGAAGIISNAQIGFREADFEKNPFQANLRAMESEYQKARKTAPDGVIGFNIMVALKHYEEYVRHAAAIGCDLIISGAGLPTELPRYVEGTDTKIAPIVSTEKSARVILKYWDRKYNRVPDLLVIEGPKAGGHLGFTKEQAHSQFGFLIDAFKYGVPPHAGLAYGLDRLVMLMAKQDSIRDVIAFPKVKDASCLMTEAPGAVDDKQLAELGLEIRAEE